MYKNRGSSDGTINNLIRRNPDAAARIHGSKAYPDINGTATFYQTQSGVFIICSIKGLPSNNNICDGTVLGLHIHEGNTCTGTRADPFADAGGHFNPDQCPHPYHAGDLPPLFADKGYAWSAFLTQRFEVKEIIDRTIILHSQPDDFTSQPSGNAGDKIACGMIRWVT